MVCPKCGSENVKVEVINEVNIKNKRHGAIWWILIGWWWILIKWIVFTLPALIIAIFKPKKQKVENVQHTVCVCQNCGNTWQIK